MKASWFFQSENQSQILVSTYDTNFKNFNQILDIFGTKYEKSPNQKKKSDLTDVKTQEHYTAYATFTSCISLLCFPLPLSIGNLPCFVHTK